MSCKTALEAAFEAQVAKTVRQIAGPAPDRPMTAAELLALADRAVARIDLWGQRGVTGVSTEEIAAMACVIALTDATGLLRRRMAATVNETTKEGAKA
jgi:hypothetical protein